MPFLCPLQIEKGGQFANKYVVVCAREHYVPVAQPSGVFGRLMKGLVNNTDQYFSKEVRPAICFDPPTLYVDVRLRFMMQWRLVQGSRAIMGITSITCRHHPAYRRLIWCISVLFVTKAGQGRPRQLDGVSYVHTHILRHNLAMHPTEPLYPTSRRLASNSELHVQRNATPS